MNLSLISESLHILHIKSHSLSSLLQCCRICRVIVSCSEERAMVCLLFNLVRNSVAMLKLSSLKLWHFLYYISSYVDELCFLKWWKWWWITGLALQAFKQAIQDPKEALKSWNDTDITPCNWWGITCFNSTDLVKSMYIPGPQNFYLWKSCIFLQVEAVDATTMILQCTFCSSCSGSFAYIIF